MVSAIPKKRNTIEIIEENKDKGSLSLVNNNLEEKVTPILEVKNLSLSFMQYIKGLHQRDLQVITGLDVAINRGEILAVVGSSGSGKSLLAHAILGILPENAKLSGNIVYEGEELTSSRKEELRGRDIALVPQSVNYLDPLMSIGKQVRLGVKEVDSKRVQKETFARYQLAEKTEQLYPFQISGGMARRVLVATATVSGAKLVIADEPTPGLDEAVIKETLADLRQLADEGAGVMLITHDIDTALKIADKIAVFYAGTTVEVAPIEDFSGKGEALRHPYTKALWNALPQNEFLPIPGSQPLPNALPSGCLFEPRCSKATSDCSKSRPVTRLIRGGMVRCIYAS